MKLRDSTEFQNWKKNTELNEKAEKEAYKQRLKMEIELARDMAVKALQDKQLENQ